MRLGYSIFRGRPRWAVQSFNEAEAHAPRIQPVAEPIKDPGELLQ